MDSKTELPGISDREISPRPDGGRGGKLIELARCDPNAHIEKVRRFRSLSLVSILTHSQLIHAVLYRRDSRCSQINNRHIATVSFAQNKTY